MCIVVIYRESVIIIITENNLNKYYLTIHTYVIHKSYTWYKTQDQNYIYE
jgi:hypothetical protein